MQALRKMYEKHQHVNNVCINMAYTKISDTKQSKMKVVSDNIYF